MTQPKPLEGIRVLGLEHFIAGPWCTQILGDGGAEIIKIERPGGGDPRRQYDPYVEKDGKRVSGGFASYNRNKKSLALDIRSKEGKDIFLRLANTADVIVDNLRPGLMERMELPPSLLLERNDRLVYCAISGFGRRNDRRGPYSDWPAFDSVIQAMSGLSSLIGEKDGPPQLAPAGTSDVLSGTYAALGILMALLHRERMGTGQFLDVSMYDVTATFLSRALMIQNWVGATPTRGGDEFAPVGAFRCGDGGYVALIIPTDEIWRRFCSAIDRKDLMNHEHLDSVLKRSAAMTDIIIPELEKWAIDKSRRQVCELLNGAGAPAGMVQSIDEVYNCDHLSARSLFLDVEDPIAGRKRYPRFPVLFSSYEQPRERSPLLGEHTIQVLAEFDIAPDVIHDLSVRRIIEHEEST